MEDGNERALTTESLVNLESFIDEDETSELSVESLELWPPREACSTGKDPSSVSQTQIRPINPHAIKIVTNKGE